MTTPQFGNCKDCAAWGRSSNMTDVQFCDRGPVACVKGPYDGCWSFIPKVERSCETCVEGPDPTSIDCPMCKTNKTLDDLWTSKEGD